VIKLSPLALLLALVGLTVVSATLHFVLNRRRGRKLQSLSQRFEMTFVRQDRFDLSREAASLVDVPGAAGVRVRDVMYASHPTGYRCVFTAEFTTGVTRGKRRMARAVAIDQWTQTGRQVMLAPPSLTLVEQYEHLLRRIANPESSLSSPSAKAE
jgi:hypothetical protein